MDLVPLARGAPEGFLPRVLAAHTYDEGTVLVGHFLGQTLPLIDRLIA
ncbi:MAG TPA: hypothetical protein VHZ03_53050 [Trebonia sp.]|jgi:hypothetical protein|nr:hypothetical protein [Trebonia sp.]